MENIINFFLWFNENLENAFEALYWLLMEIPAFKLVINLLGFKLVLVLCFLLLLRGGTPRYRFDYLTKLGWFKTFLYVISTLLIIYYIYNLC